MSALTDLIRRKQPGEAWETAAEGGASGEVLIGEVTAGPDTFTTTYTFDVGGVRAAYIVAEITAADPDGEPWGEDPGEILADLRHIMASDGVDEAVLSGWVLDTVYQGDPLPIVTHKQWGVTPGLVIVTANIIEGNTFDPYSGSNHPQATWALTLYV